MRRTSIHRLIFGIFCISALPLAGATTIVVRPPCFSPVLVIVPGEQPKPEVQRVRKTLEETSDKQCVWEFLQSHGTPEADAQELTQIMLADPVSSMRRHAAEALSQAQSERKVVLAALATDFDKEADADVQEARVTSIGELFWPDEPADVRNLVSSLAFSHEGRSAEDVQKVNAAKAFLLAQLISRIAAAKPMAAKELWAIASDELLRDLHMLQLAALSDAKWLLPPLEVFVDALANEVVELDQARQASLLAALQKTMTSDDEAVRANSIKVMTRLNVAHMAPSASASLLASSVSAAHDSSPQVRAYAVGLLGKLLRARAGAGAELLPALKDSEELVRIEAVNALKDLPSLPALAKPVLASMAKRDGVEAVAAIEALSQDGGADAMQVFIEVIVSKAYRFADDFDRPSPIVAAIRALGKSGSTAILPLLAKSVMASDDGIQGCLYAALVNAGWLQADLDPGEVELALTPAITGTNEEARLFAMSLLAMQPLHDNHRYASALVDGMAERYIPIKSRRLKKGAANPKDLGLSAGTGASPYWNDMWRMPLPMAASIVAGGSDSKVAAERMVSWVCSRDRLELAFVGKGYSTFSGSPLYVEIETSKTMASSLGKMGGIAEPYIAGALAQRKRTALCQRYLAGQES